MALATSASLLAVGCDSSASQPTHSPRPPVNVPAIEAGVPISSAPPLRGFAVVSPLALVPEHPIGRVAFLLDAAAGALYEYDLGRGRFIGPSVAATDPLGRIRNFPGYPFSLGLTQPAQDACVRDGTILVAGGVTGELVLLATATMAARHVVLPTVTVQRNSRDGGGTAVNSSVQGPHPFVAFVACVGGGRGIAISAEPQDGTSVAYLVDTQQGVVLGSHQLPGAVTDAVAADPTSDDFYIGTNDGSAFTVTTGFQTHQVYAAPADSADQAVIHVVPLGPNGPVALRLHPPQLLLIDSGGHRLSEAERPLDQYGTVARAENGWWVANPDRGTVLLVGEDGKVKRSVSVCKGVFAVAEVGSTLLVSCRNQQSVGYAVFDRVDLTSGAIQSTYGGGDPLVWAS